jgi:type 2 lantibiotic biosynthesis protein LanM
VGFVDESADVLTRRSLERLGEADLDKQRWFVHSSLCTLNPGGLRITRRTASPTVPDHDGSDRARLIGQARAIGDRLAVLASVSGGRAGWNGLVLAGRNDWLVRPSGSNLYDGTAGIVLFLAYLAAVTDEERYRDLARFGAASLYDGYLHIADTRPEIGLFNGRGGLIYLCTHLATLWDDDRYLDLAYSAVDDLQEHVGQDQNYDIISGAAGCIGSLLALWRAAPSDALLRTAVRCGDHLLRSARPITGGLGWPSALSEAPLAGFSHGAAGIASALVALTRATTDTRFRQAAVAALGYERGLFDETTRNWADLRTVEGVARNPESTLAVWCHGAAGVGLSRVAMLRELDDGMVREEITHAAETTLATGFGDNHSLCHGDLGNLDFIFQAADALDNDAWRERAHDQLRRSLADIERNGWRCGIENSAEVPGLMTGLAGIGLGLLRLAEPHRVPSVLLASAPAGMPAPGRHQQMPDEVTTTGGASA